MLQGSFSFATPAHSARRRNQVIEAGAGTGKTSAIVAEVLRLLLENEELLPERIVLVTFTEKAAGEIADRIHEALASLEARFDEPRVCWPASSATPLLVVPDDRKEAWRQACRRQLARIGSLRSQTIHSFCQSLLRSWPIEAQLDPQFKLIEGYERSLLYSHLYDAWIDDDTRLHPTSESLAQWECLLTSSGYLFQVSGQIFGLLSRRDLLDDTSYELTGFEECQDEICRSIEDVRRADISGVTHQDTLRALSYLQATPPPPRGTIDGWIDYFAPIAPAIRNSDLRSVRGGPLNASLKVLRGEKKGTCIHDRLVAHRAAVALVAMARRFAAFLDAEKRKLGVVDFDDLLLRTLALLRNPNTADRIRSQFDYIFVDEFQDTDRIQAQIFNLLSRDRVGTWVPGRLVVVGDPKQSIYGFRRADLQTYQQTADELELGGAEHRRLPTNFRSDPPLLDAMNALFSAVFAAPGDANVVRPSYKPLVPGRPFDGDAGEARFTFLHATNADGDAKRGEAESTARWILARRDGSSRDLQRFAILFRRMKYLDEYLDVLDRYGIPFVLPPTKLFLERRAAVDLLAVLRAIARGFDRGSEICAARTPYFGLTDDEITIGCLGGGSAAWAAFHRALEGYRALSSQLTVSALIDRIVATTSIEDVYAATVDGARSRRHLEHVRALAFDFDQKLGGSIRDFVDEIDRRREEPDEMEPSLSDESTNAVRVMTVHAAKGLEFDTVLLPDLAFQGGGGGVQLFTVEDPRRLVLTGGPQSLSATFEKTASGQELKEVASARDQAELHRLLYVAVTRARREVVFVTNPDEFKNGGFFGCLAEAFGFQKPTFAAMWEDGPSRAIRTLSAGGTSVPVAFEKLAVEIGAELQTGQPAARRRLADNALEQRLAAGPLVAPDIVIPAELMALGRAEANIAHARSRNRAAGILLHRLIELWDGHSDPAELLGKLASEQGAGDRTLSAVRDRIERLRASNVVRRIAAAETIATELPIRFIDENGREVERRIDRLIREDGREVVIDYKSGNPDAGRTAHDTAQVARYCSAVAAMTGRPCEGLIWYIDTDSLVSLPA